MEVYVHGKILYQPVPHSYEQAPEDKAWTGYTYYIQNMVTGDVGENTVFARHADHFHLLLDHWNSTDKNHKYSSRQP